MRPPATLSGSEGSGTRDLSFRREAKVMLNWNKGVNVIVSEAKQSRPMSDIAWAQRCSQWHPSYQDSQGGYSLDKGGYYEH